MTRRDEDNRIGLALGGGGARGWGHIGVIHALEALGLSVSVVAGTSMGAVIGAGVATRQTGAIEDWARALSWRSVMGYVDLGFGGGLLRARRVLEQVESIVKDRPIEDLDIPFGAVATELETGREQWFTSGGLFDAIRASIAIPGLIQPARIDGRWYVDGGLVNPVPVTLCRALGATYVIAVDLGAGLVGKPPLPPPKTERSTEGQGFLELLRARGRELQAREEKAGADVPSLYEVTAASVNIMQRRIGSSRLAGDPPDLLIRPMLADVGLLDFHRAEECIEEGQRAAELVLVPALGGRTPPDQGLLG